VFFGFFDGSYEGRDNSRIISVAGFVAPLEIWEAFDEKWWSIVRQPTHPLRLTRFHAFDCTHGIDEFESWKFAERLGLWGDLVGLLVDSKLVAIHAVLVREHFDALDEPMKKRIGSPYHFLVEAAMQFGIGFVRDHYPSDEIWFVFDVENQPIAQESRQRYLNYIHDPNWNRNLAGVAQSSSIKMAALQTADLLAYGGYRHYLKKFYPDALDMDFPLPPAFARLVKQVENTGGVYEKTALAKIVEQIKEREGQQ